MAKSPRDRRADIRFCTKSNHLGISVIFYIVIQSTGLIFPPSLPIGKKLGSNVTFMYSKKLCAKLNLTHRVIFIIKLPFVFGCHSLLTHLLISEFAVLLFDCERYRLAAESCQQLYFYLRAIKVFCSAFLQKSAFPRFLCSFLFKKKARILRTP